MTTYTSRTQLHYLEDARFADACADNMLGMAIEKEQIGDRILSETYFACAERHAHYAGMCRYRAEITS